MQEKYEWPIARTEYPRWYFDAAAPNWNGEREGFLSLSREQPNAEAAATYSAEAGPDHASGGPSRFRVDGESAPAHPRSTGLAFISGPVAEDFVLAGYGRVKLWVSSSGEDMDIQVALRITDEHDKEADFTSPVTVGFPARIHPLAKGRLTASRRRPDAERRTAPEHQHRAVDHAASARVGVIAVEIDLIPITTLVRRGQRIRIDVQPYDEQGHLRQYAYEVGQRISATNTVHTGPAHLGYVQLPLTAAQFDC
jgi:hypothetical protein